MSDTRTIQISDSVTALGKAQWDACAGSDNPFVSFDFLSILEESGSVGPGTAWSPARVHLRDEGR